MDLYHALLTPIPIGNMPPTSGMEILAVIFTVLSVFGATRLKISQYPVGIVATLLYSFVFFDAKLYSSLALNVYFTIIQLYGWYFWMFGGSRVTGNSGPFRLKEPLIGDWPWKVVGLWAAVAAIISVIVGSLVAHYLHGSNALLDAAILAASVLAQFLLDRKQLKSWIVWMVVNALSIYVYSEQKLVMSGVLYTALFLNAIYGYRHWRWTKRQRDEWQGPRMDDGTPVMIRVWEKGTQV